MKSLKHMLGVLLAVATVAGAAAAAEVPLTKVVLFSSGVGYFERAGNVQGDVTTDLTFRTDQINDVLKSLVLQDLGGGTIAPVTYASQAPLERTLSSFAINISDAPRVSELWNRLRGSRVQIVADGQTVEGVVFGTETQEKTAGDKTVEFEVLNLLTDKGLRQFPLWHVRSIKLLDPKLQADLDKALAALDKNRSTDRQPVTLSFRGQGTRPVRVGYLLESPVWKTTYRLVSDKDGLFLQGWALVENTTDDDWTKVNLSLVSGRPVSFTQDLRQPLYLPRPQMPVMVAAAARPRVYEGNLEREEAAADAVGGGYGGGGMGGAPGAPAAKAARRAGPLGQAGPAGPAGPPAPAPAFAESYAAAATLRPTAPALATGGEVGTVFQYAVNQPVTIARQQSAMIPIIGEKVEGEKVSVYNASADPRHPMNGIRLKNSTKLHLMGGALTVFDEGAYAGDALIEDIAPGAERLLTYAMDLPVEVEPKADSRPTLLVKGKIAHGVMQLTMRDHLETVYTIKNDASEKRLVLVEHPLRQDWELLEPKQADERTRSVYRFRVPVEAHQTAKLRVVEEHPQLEEISLANDPDRVRLLFLAPELSEAMRAALGKLIKMQDDLSALTRQREAKETRVKEITAEQDRIRQNMHELEKTSELYKQYVEKLTRQETELDKLREEAAALRDQETAARKQIADYVAGLNVQ